MRRLIILYCWPSTDESPLETELKNSQTSLVEGYLLHWYEIKQIIGRGGFGITYLAQDNNLHRNVAIKEFMPEDFATRDFDSTVRPKTGGYKELYDWGLERFVDEARTLAKFNHPNIVRVLSVFEENNTAYMIMEYAQGRDLSGIYKEPDKMSEAELLDIFIPVMSGLALVHDAGFIHRDIKPANIYIRDDDSPLLLDFGSARQSIGGKTRALTSLVTFGYAPFEQYNEGSGKQGAWTDIYSLGASLYVGVAGKRPVDALSRCGGFIDSGQDTYEPASIIAKGEYSDNFLLAIDKALMFKIEDRPADILLCADMLQGRIQAPELPDFMKGSSDYGADEFVLPEIPTADSIPDLVNARVARHARENKTVVKNKNLRQASSADLLDIAQSSIGQTEYGQMKKGLKRDGSTQYGPVKPRPTSARSMKFGLLTLLLATGVAGLATAGWYFYQLPATPGTVEVVKPEQQAQNKLQKQLASQAEAKQARIERARIKLAKDKAKKARDRQQKQKRIDRLITAAKDAISKGSYASPADKNAYTYYRQVLKLKAGHTTAVEGLKNIEKELLSLASSAYFDKRYKQSKSYLQQLKIVNPDSSAAKKLQIRLESEQKLNAQVTAWMVQAKKHIKNNRFTKPSGNNAYEVYQKILNRQPQNAQALRGVESIQQQYIVLFKKHVSAVRLKKAERDILTMKKISVAAADIKKMQKTLKLAQRKQRRLALANKKSAPEKLVQKKLSMEQASQKVFQFKTALQSGNKRGLKQISQYEADREEFVNDLLDQYKKINVKILSLKLIASENKAHAHIALYDLVDFKDRKVSPGGWSQFEITLSYNSRNQLKVIW